MKDEQYIISESSYRLLIWDLFTILVQYISLARRLSEAEKKRTLSVCNGALLTMKNGCIAAFAAGGFPQTVNPLLATPCKTALWRNTLPRYQIVLRTTPALTKLKYEQCVSQRTQVGGDEN